jgi:hypothetical protein
MNRNRLAVRVLIVAEYPQSGHGCTTRSYPMPTWERIEDVIRALDHHCLPFFGLCLSDTRERKNAFEVMGGPNGYYLTAGIAGTGHVPFCYPTHTR